MGCNSSTSAGSSSQQNKPDDKPTESGDSAQQEQPNQGESPIIAHSTPSHARLLHRSHIDPALFVLAKMVNLFKK